MIFEFELNVDLGIKKSTFLNEYIFKEATV